MTQEEQSLADRLAALETKVDLLLVMFERTTGAWILLKWLGAIAVGVVAIWAFIWDHVVVHFK